MLAAMGERSFVVTIAYIKTEPVQVALFGLIFLGDALTPLIGRAILIATAGVIVMSLKPGAGRPAQRARRCSGLPPARMFALSAIGYRGAILSLQLPDFVMAATFTLAVGPADAGRRCCRLYLVLRDPDVMRAIMQAWRPSLFAGFMGAIASQFWFLAFALATAASVRTLALVEVLFAQAISRFVFEQPTTAREGARHRADRGRRRAADVGVLSGDPWSQRMAELSTMHGCHDPLFCRSPLPLIPLVRQHRQRMKFDAFLGKSLASSGEASP